jgi:manganese/zinc/iron transport system substrate-binding protein
MLRATFSSLLLITSLSIGCNNHCDSDSNGSDEKPKGISVLCTTGMIADLVQNIGGEFVQVDTLMGPGVDPHRYIPTARDLDRLQSAKAIFYNGLHLEGKMADIFGTLAKTQKTLAIGEAIAWKPGELRTIEEGTHIPDPHIWFDVQLWAKTIDPVQKLLSELDPAHQADFERNAGKYRQELVALDAEIRKQLEAVPKERRLLATCHDAFGYFGRAYGFEVHGLQGVSTASDSSSAEVRELARLLSNRRIPTIFGETSVPDKGIRAVQSAVKKDANFEIKLSEKLLYSDALGEVGSDAETYIKMVRMNVSTIVGALAQ